MSPALLFIGMTFFSGEHIAQAKRPLAENSMAQLLQDVQSEEWASLSADERATMFFVSGSQDVWEKLSDVRPSATTQVSLCIPCVPEDLEALQDTLVPSIKAQTLKPKEVIVALSSASTEESQRLETTLRGSLMDIPVKVTGKEGTAYAGENRNRAEGLATGDLVAFFDADDAMHPRRLEVLAYVWAKYHPKVILHGWSKGVTQVEPLEDEFEIIKGKEITTNGLQMLGPLTHAVHQGQPAVDKQVFAQVREQGELPRAQDVRFLNDVMDTFGRFDETILYVGLPLTRFGNWRTGR